MTPYGYPPNHYHCLLDEQPYYLVPPRLYSQPSAEQLYVNPHCWFSWHGPLPVDRAARVMAAEYLYPSEWLVWVDDPGSRSVWPYWVGAEYHSYLANLVPGQPAPHDLPPHAQWVLSAANILVGSGYADLRRKEWMDTSWASAKSFERGYVNIAGLIPPFHLGALRRYYRYHTRAGSFTLGDGQVAKRYVAHNEPIARFFHCQLTHAVGDVARTLVKPSYSYLAAYESGSVLERHTDREQCEFSVTLCIDATPEPHAQPPWPIHLDIPEGALRIWQHIGDGLLYRGRYLPHYRDWLPDGYTYTALLLHYVDRGYDGPLQ